MFFYARADTHFLLYIYDNLRNELIDRSDTTNPEEDRLQRVLQKSQETSLLRFERQIYDEETGKGPGGWLPLLIKTPALLNNEQFAVFRAVHAWRDKIARKDDDSTNFVMPNHVIFTIAKLMPTDMSALFAAVHPISHNVKSRIGELLSLIKSAKLAGVDGPSMMDVIRPDSVTSVRKSNGSSTKPVEAGQSTYHLVVDGPLRSDKSKFWGGAFGSSVWEPPSGNKINNGLRLAVPLPPLSADAFATISADGLTDRSRKVGESVNSQEIARPAPVQEEPFVVKAGKKRKPQEMTTDTVHPSPDAAEEGPTGDYDISLHEEEEEEAAQRAARKADRRAQKKLAKAQRKLAERGVMESAEDDEGEEEEEEDFDYSKAEPVLHGKRDRVDGNTSKRKKPFDPYAKSSDAPKGMRRLQTERPGKSHTFRS
jgi:exosome complex exonuclease RRP6